MRRIWTASMAAMAIAFIAAPASAQAPWSASGELTDDDSDDEDHRYDDHVLRLEAGQRYRISVDSTAFDPVARLYSEGENQPVAENDDSNGLNPRITYTPAASGDYVLRVLNFSAEGRGAYTAEAAPMAPLPPPVTTPGTSVPASGTWSLWEGELAASDPDIGGHHYDDYLIRIEAGQRRFISLEATDFDPLVQLIGAAERDSDPFESVDGDDDAGVGLNSLLAFAPEEAGDFIVRVTSFGEGAGAYRLWISR